MDTDFYPDIRPMSQAEVDAEMDSFRRQERDRKVAENATQDAKYLAQEALHAAAKKTAEPEVEVKLSPMMQEAKNRMSALLYAPTKPLKSVALPSGPGALKKEALTKTHSIGHDTRVDPEVVATPLIAETSPKDVVALASPATDVTHFPVHDVHTVKEFDDPQRAMDDLCRRILSHHDYLRERDAYCHLSIRLNLIGLLAPAYRPELTVKAPKGSEVFHQVNRDQVVIDLHWCHATKMPLMPKDASHAALLREDVDFSFDGAWAIVLKKWKNGYRAAEALCLTTFQQCQMLKLRSPELVARFKSLDSGWRDSAGKSAGKLAEATRLISQWAERDKRIGLVRHEYLKLWLARELLGRDASKTQIAGLLALMMGGKVKDRASIRDMCNKLDKHVPVSL